MGAFCLLTPTGDVQKAFVIIAAIVLALRPALTSSIGEPGLQTAVDALREKVALRAEVRRDRRWKPPFRGSVQLVPRRYRPALRRAIWSRPTGCSFSTRDL